jgi:hypothetical protein
MRIAPIILLVLPLAAQSATVTFNHDVAPIIYQNCSSCHRPGEATPFSLLSYEDVTHKAATIAKVTRLRVMPPWKPAPSSFPFMDDRRLTDEQIAVIQDWVKQGMAEGSAADKPEPPKFDSGWALGQPDLVVEMPVAFHVPADGPDIYRNIAVPLGVTEDKWVAAVDIHPSARAVVHHVLYFADPNARAHLKASPDNQPGYNGLLPGTAVLPLGGWAVGGQPHLYPGGLALRLPKGSDLVVQYHFHPTGKPETEKSQIAFYFAKKAPSRTLARIQMPPDYSLFSGLDIPAGDKDFVIRDSYTLPVAVDAVGMSAHAHYLCTKMKMTATLPDGSVKTLLDIPDWDFAWQDRYFFQQFQPLPQGSRLDAEIHWDNTDANPRNPTTPPVHVSWGEQTTDEMGSISLVAVPHRELDIFRLQTDLNQRRRTLAREKMASDPALARKVAALLAE